MNITPSPRAFASCPRCGVTVPDKTEIDDEYEFCYKCDLELSELAGGWASWNRNSPPVATDFATEPARTYP